MKKVLIAAFVIVSVAVACKNKKGDKSVVLQSGLKDQVHQLDSANYTSIEWQDSIKNFGTVTKGELVKITFKFTNTGDKPLFISSVRPSCGCTVADYTKGAVLPNQQGEVTGQFDSNHGSPGQIRKSMYVTSNTKNKTNYTLVFEGEVKEKKS